MRSGSDPDLIPEVLRIGTRRRSITSCSDRRRRTLRRSETFETRRRIPASGAQLALLRPPRFVIDDEALNDAIRAHFTRSAELKLRAADTCVADIRRAVGLIVDALRTGGKLLICGGSAADAQHMAAEFMNRLTTDFERPGLPAMALTTDFSILTAHANDFDFDDVFARQVQAHERRAPRHQHQRIVQRTSCASPARAVGMEVIMLVDGAGTARADETICIPSGVTAHIQECHLAVEHIICHLVEQNLFTAEDNPSLEFLTLLASRPRPVFIQAI
jgi:D-sedoheptulose 7-phosphate isomerase